MKKIFKATTAQPVTGDTLAAEQVTTIRRLRGNLPLPKHTIVDAGEYAQVTVATLDVVLPATPVVEGAPKPVAAGKVAKQVLKDTKYPVIIVASKEQEKFSDFDTILENELDFKLHKLATDVIFKKLATGTTASGDLMTALDSIEYGSGIIAGRAKAILPLIEKYKTESIGDFRFVIDANIPDDKVHILADDGLILSMSINHELASEAMINMEGGAGAGNTTLSLFQQDMIGHKFELFIDVAARSGAYAVV